MDAQPSRTRPDRPRRPVEVVVFAESCKACGLCIDVCPTRVFDETPRERRPVVARIEACTACDLCELLCPDWAISVRAGAGAAADA